MKAIWGLLERCLVHEQEIVGEKVSNKWHCQARIFTGICPSLKLPGRDFSQNKITPAYVFSAIRCLISLGDLRKGQQHETEQGVRLQSAVKLRRLAPLAEHEQTHFQAFFFPLEKQAIRDLPALAQPPAASLSPFPATVFLALI